MTTMRLPRQMDQRLLVEEPDLSQARRWLVLAATSRKTSFSTKMLQVLRGEGGMRRKTTGERDNNNTNEK